MSFSILPSVVQVTGALHIVTNLDDEKSAVDRILQAHEANGHRMSELRHQGAQERLFAEATGGVRFVDRRQHRRAAARRVDAHSR